MIASGFETASWISCPEQKTTIYGFPWSNIEFNSRELTIEPTQGLPFFRKDFTAAKSVKSAILSASGLGIFELYVNGTRVGTESSDGTVFDELKPGWTDYTKRVLAYTYDVTKLLASGENSITSIMSAGWWSGKISFGYYGCKKSAFIAALDITYRDGSHETISTDTSWKSTVSGPVLYADIWDGEYYDSRIKNPASLKTSELTCGNAEHFEFFDGKISIAESPFIRVRKNLTRKPISAVVYCGTTNNGNDYGKINITNSSFGNDCGHQKIGKDSLLILDFGQNMVGRPNIKIKAKAGTRIEIMCGEFLNDTGLESHGNDGPEGSLYIKNYRGARARAVYIASGNGIESYFPMFSFYGFRYLEFRANDDYELISALGEVIGSENRETSSLITSNEEINRLYSNILWGQRGNYLSVPTDCPQRDERLGWTGDTQVFCAAAAYNADVSGFFKKWLCDVRDSQSENGGYCDVVPRVLPSEDNNNNAFWGDAGIIVPYTIYMFYGERSIIEDAFPSMERYMKRLADLPFEKRQNSYSDWLSYEPTDKIFMSIASYAYNASLMSKMSSFLSTGNGDFYDLRKAFYDEAFASVKSAFYERFVREDELTEKSQCAYLLALAFGLVDGKLKENCIKALEKKIIGNNYTLSTGFIGTGVLNRTLSQVGLDGLAYSLLLQTRNPSWLYSVRQGATTIWERWNSFMKDTGFGDVGMNSYNHYAYGAVCEWMFESMAGIRKDPASPAFRHFFLDPRPDTRRQCELPGGQTNITFVKASYDSASGLIKSAWEITDGVLIYSFTIPENTSATVMYPLINGVKPLNVNGVETEYRLENGRAVFEFGAGDYKITENY